METPGGSCPACGEPLFAWYEVPPSERLGRVELIVDRCESCSLAVARDGGLQDLDLFLARLDSQGQDLDLVLPNAGSSQAGLGAESWTGLGPDKRFALTATSLRLLAAKRGLRAGRPRFRAVAGMAAMWQTILNLLTFNRDFATRALRGQLRPRGGRGVAAAAIDAAVSLLAAVPVAAIAVIAEGAAVLARRGGVMEVALRPD